MGFPPVVIIIIVAIFSISFLSLIPIALMNKNKAKNIDEFKSENSSKAVLYLYAVDPVIDGVKAEHLNYIKGEGGSGIKIVALDPGTHVIEAKYETTAPGGGRDKNYKTPKPISCEVDLEAGYEHNIAIYFYSPEERYNYYKGDVGQVVGGVELSVSGFGVSNAYVICYKEGKL